MTDEPDLTDFGDYYVPDESDGVVASVILQGTDVTSPST